MHCISHLFFNFLYRVKYIVTKHASPPMALDMGSARNTPSTPAPSLGSNMVRGATITALRSREKKIAWREYPRAVKADCMEEVDAMIGRNSYFSKEMLAPYYYGNDMEESPVTGQQHREFYEGDHVTGAFARYMIEAGVGALRLYFFGFFFMAFQFSWKRSNVTFSKLLSGFSDSPVISALFSIYFQLLLVKDVFIIFHHFFLIFPVFHALSHGE